MKRKKISKQNLITIVCTAVILGALLFLGYHHLLQPYFSELATDEYRELYHSDATASTVDNPATDTDYTEPEAGSISPPSENSTLENESCVLIAETPENIAKFQSLIDKNSDICGWIQIPGTNIDYPVVFATEDKTDYYLNHNIDGDEDKNGSLFIDYRTELVSDSKVLVINGHNMTSTGQMFNELTEYKNLAFYQQNPIFSFDTVYGDAQWKIIALIKTNNNEKQGERFNYFRDDFSSDAEFLEFVHQLELRSIFHCPVTVNENDSLLILSTCTYEMNDMRFLVVAREVRENEDPTVDTSLSYKRDNVLYPDGWYTQYGGTKPNITSFTEAYEAGEVTWYDGDFFEVSE